MLHRDDSLETSERSLSLSNFNCTTHLLSLLILPLVVPSKLTPLNGDVEREWEAGDDEIEEEEVEVEEVEVERR